MKNISAEVGKRIRLYRKAKKMSLEELSKAIHKSKSTLSKYETGEISIDVETLFDIARVIKVSPIQLIKAETLPQNNQKDPNILGDIQYIYMFDGRANKILKSVLEHSAWENGESNATLFYNVPSFEQYEKCKSLYFGKVYEHDFITNYSLKNQINPIEHIFLCTVKSFEMTNKKIGMLSGISSRNFLPVSAKCVISNEILEENSSLMENLMLSKEDLRLIKRFNMFIIDQMI